MANMPNSAVSIGSSNIPNTSNKWFVFANTSLGSTPNANSRTSYNINCYKQFFNTIKPKKQNGDEWLDLRKEEVGNVFSSPMEHWIDVQIQNERITVRPNGQLFVHWDVLREYNYPTGYVRLRQ